LRRRSKIIATSLLLAGCSSAQRISENANEIRSEAISLQDHGRTIKDEFVIQSATRIHDLAAGIHEDLTGVEDRVSEWASVLWWLAVAAVVVGVCVVLWQTGIGTAIRVAVGWIPRAKQREADLAAEVIDRDKPENVREWIAARRAADPLFDAGFKKARKAGKKK